jgi:pimeloyl-ACP methyl ester carboxylesterase
VNTLASTPTILAFNGAFTRPGYMYPLVQLMYPQQFIVPHFNRDTWRRPLHISHYAQFIKTNVQEYNQPVVLLGHSAGAVATYQATKVICEHKLDHLIKGIILLCPANIGPGSTRTFDWAYFTQHAYASIFSDTNRDVKRKVRKTYEQHNVRFPGVRLRHESFPLVQSALSGNVAADSPFPRDNMLIVKAGLDDVTTPANTIPNT